MKKCAVCGLCAAVLLLALVPGCLGKEEDEPLKRSTQTKESEKSQKAMEALAEPEAVETQADEYGLVAMTASVKIPDYSLYFSECWEEASQEAGDEAEFEEKLFALAEERTRSGDVEWTTREVTVNLSMLDGEKEEWSEEELAEAARREAFEQEMEEFALELMEEVLSQSVDVETYADGGEGEQ